MENIYDTYRIKGTQNAQDYKDALNEYEKSAAFDSSKMRMADAQTAVIKAICKTYPNPLLMDDPHKALEAFRGLVETAVERYCTDLNVRFKTNLKHQGGRAKIDGFMLRAIIAEYYTIYNFCVSASKKRSGILMAISKDAERDPAGNFVKLEDIVKDFADILITDTNTNTDKLTEKFIGYSGVIIHETSYIKENRNPYLAKCTAFLNGIYHPDIYPTKGLITNREAVNEYGLFITKRCAANYKGPQNPAPVMIDGWSPDTWSPETYGTTPERDAQIFAIILAVLRPYDTQYDRAIFLLDEGDGSTAKSTYTTLLRAIAGEDGYLTANLSAMEKEYHLTDLSNMSCFLIVADENEPREYIETAVNFKSLCTGDPILINVKNKDPKKIVFRGRIVQIINGMIRSRDNTTSFYRRVYPTIWRNRFDPGDGLGGAKKNKNIKEAWMQNQDVIDYFCTEAINRNIDTLPATAESKDILANMEESNNDILRFVNDYVNNMQQAWFTPKLLYPAYVAFCTAEGRGRGSQTKSYNTFSEDLKKVLRRPESLWTCNYDDDGEIKPTKMDKYAIPLNGVELMDPVYEILKDATSTANNRAYGDVNTVEAKRALELLYRSEKPGTQRGAYYRKEATLPNLYAEIMQDVIGAMYSDEDLTLDEMAQLLRDGCAYTPENPFDENGLNKGETLVRKCPDDVYLVKVTDEEAHKTAKTRKYLVDKLTKKGA